MKSFCYLIFTIWISFLVLGLQGCGDSTASSTSPEGSSEPDYVQGLLLGSCWDAELPQGEASQNMTKWQNNWSNAPTTFPLGTQYLDSVLASVNESLGYRLYFGLKTQSDISSLILLMTPMDANGNDVLSENSETPVTELSTSGYSPISIASAITYAQNWRNHFSVDQQTDTLSCTGEGVCGQLSEGDKLVAPLAQTYSKRSTFAFLYESGIGSGTNGTIDLKMALPEVLTQIYEIDVYVTTSSNQKVLDFSRPCPKGCGQGNNLNDGASN